ncbi:hypothetical protein [Gelidibacter salicanalis]|uniref:Lipoprotein n=1 Tax=Gelidibacter salicanalis TaxID=291193 RepID=A0A934KTP7_9FLAO|nr:hypothetical protein [Gelidibacter salicanalis]MBJ7881855.1 hypothetical protein [Gelidibacter salicanalis]
MKNILKTIRLTILLGVTMYMVSCSSEASLEADYVVPNELPGNIVPGTLLSNRILKLYNDYGIVVYTDVSDPRMYKDLVSEEGLNISADRIAADTTAALIYIDMIEKEFINGLPNNKLHIVPRNFYLFKNDLIAGTSAFNSYEYISKIWYNSNGDLTVGSLRNVGLDSVKLKQTFYYGLSNILRNDAVNSNSFYAPFVEINTDARVYYWQVNSLDQAYEKGFLSSNQNLIKSNQQDFDLYAAWAATTPPQTRDSILNLYPQIKSKYDLVNAMFKQEGIDLTIVNRNWQESTFNPKNN